MLLVDEHVPSRDKPRCRLGQEGPPIRAADARIAMPLRQQLYRTGDKGVGSRGRGRAQTPLQDKDKEGEVEVLGVSDRNACSRRLPQTRWHTYRDLYRLDDIHTATYTDSMAYIPRPILAQADSLLRGGSMTIYPKSSCPASANSGRVDPWVFVESIR